jgi:hypothetical protein
VSPLIPALTPADAGQRLQDDGLLALGLAAPQLSPAWSGADVSYDADALTLTMSAGGGVRPAFLGIRTWVPDLRATGLYDVAGLPQQGIGAVLRLHPQAASRLERLVAGRLGAGGGGAVHPVPHTMLARCPTDGNTTPQWFGPGASLDLAAGDSAIVSFHDARGLIVDPVAVAALLADLGGALPALAPMGMGAPATAGSVANVAAKATGILVQVVDPHGAPFRPVDGLAPVEVDGATVVGPIAAGGMLTLAAGHGLALPAGPTAAARLRLGWARNSTLGRTPITPPGLPAGVSLPRQFLRACAVDLSWHLLGNRAAGTVNDIGPADQSIAAEFRPQVRDRVRLDYLVDGVDVLGAGGQALGAITAGWTGLAFAAAPVLDAGVGVPPGSPAPNRWPAFPAPPAPGAAPTAPPSTGLTATWSGPRDVVLAFPGNTIAVGSHVRAYPQVFQTINSIGPTPSFIRGDGAAAVVTTASPFSLALTDPLHLPAAANQPAGSLLIVDLVVTDRAGNTRTFANINVPITTGAPAAAPADQFGTPDPLAALDPGGLRAIAPSPVFGIPQPQPGPATTTPTSFVELLRRFAGEGNPRVGPRLPTMARFASLVVVGTGPTSAPLAWDAVVSGARWARETRSIDYARGNPGNPAGPDVHAAGVRVDGAAGFDAAQIALRRTLPLLPFVAGNSGWIPFVANTGWVAPAEPASDAAPPGQAARTCAAAVLRTVAVGCETPELGLIGTIPDAGASVQNLINDIAGALNVPAPGFAIANEAQIVRELRREFFTNRFGHRDAQWALRRALKQARDLVLVCSPQFAQTSYPKEPPAVAAAHEVDLVAELAARMAEQPSLLVLVCVPRWPDPDPRYGGWVRQAFAARKAALAKLTAVDAKRVVAFHPNGFPGRHVALRSTTVVVDDVWAIVGSSHFRRRGMTFDEGVDVSGFDRALDGGGASSRIRTFRQALLAELTGVRRPAPGASDADWSRLAGTRSCVDLVGDLVSEGGLGRLAPFWEGPTDTDIIAQSDHVADPDGGTSDEYLLRFASLIGESAG